MTSAATHQKPVETEHTTGKVAALAAVMLIPIGGLAMPAKIALGMLAFAVIMWVTEAVTYPVSAVMIVGLIAIMLTFAPGPKPGRPSGRRKA